MIFEDKVFCDFRGGVAGCVGSPQKEVFGALLLDGMVGPKPGSVAMGNNTGEIHSQTSLLVFAPHSKTVLVIQLYICSQELPSVIFTASSLFPSSA